MATQLSVRKAYTAMYNFLSEYYQRTGSDDVGALLGSMSLLGDGGTADPAIWTEWLESVRKAEESEEDITLKLQSR